ncbi:MAG: hypothetical protein KGP28_04740 [Bdellovibrionales bacterium]|nr:hypothetical protein [Bdellovibrionales bacterium]
MSNRALLVNLFLLALFFGGLNHLITRPLPPVQPLPKGAFEPTPARQERVPASVDQLKLVSEINAVIGEHPRMLGSNFTGKSSLGLNLGDPEEVAYFMSDQGRAEFFSRFKNTQNFEPFIEDLEQAWMNVDGSDLSKREALLEISLGLSGFTKSERLGSQILGEYDRYQKSIDQPEARDYAARALQGYLDHEHDQKKRYQELAKRGIPVIVLDSSKTNN